MSRKDLFIKALLLAALLCLMAGCGKKETEEPETTEMVVTTENLPETTTKEDTITEEETTTEEAVTFPPAPEGEFLRVLPVKYNGDQMMSCMIEYSLEPSDLEIEERYQRFFVTWEDVCEKWNFSDFRLLLSEEDFPGIVPSPVGIVYDKKDQPGAEGQSAFYGVYKIYKSEGGVEENVTLFYRYMIGDYYITFTMEQWTAEAEGKVNQTRYGDAAEEIPLEVESFVTQSGANGCTLMYMPYGEDESIGYGSIQVVKDHVFYNITMDYWYGVQDEEVREILQKIEDIVKDSL